MKQIVTYYESVADAVRPHPAYETGERRVLVSWTEVLEYFDLYEDDEWHEVVSGMQTIRLSDRRVISVEDYRRPEVHVGIASM